MLLYACSNCSQIVVDTNIQSENTSTTKNNIVILNEQGFSIKKNLNCMKFSNEKLFIILYYSSELTWY